jgi:thioredoxin reductase (NADPH)
MYDIIIVGAGPAGLTAAIYACRAMKKTLVLEAAVCGGQIISTNEIENYPAEAKISGFELAQKMSAQAKELGAEIKYEKVVKIIDSGAEKIVKTEENEYHAKAVILATGTEVRKLGLEHESEYAGRGVSYCATCDGAFYKDKVVAVAGGGSGALYEALYLSDIVKKLYLIHRRSEFRGEEILVQKLKKQKNVEFVLNSNIIKLQGENKLEKIIIKSEEDTREIPLDGLFVAIGREPKMKEMAPFIKLDDAGFADAGESCETNVAGIFVAGDNRKKSTRQIVTAVSDGAIAATNAIRCINNGK